MTRSKTDRHRGGRPPGPDINRSLLRERRVQLGISRPGLSRRMAELGVRAPKQSIYQWERGLCRPPQKTLAAWALILGLEARQALRVSA